MSRPLRSAFAALLAVLALPHAEAGEFTLVSMQYSESHPVPHIHYEGEVLADDPGKLAAIYDRFVRCRTECIGAEGGATAVLTLDSIGGIYRAGIAMAEFLRDNHVAAVVEEDMECYSACAFAFLGGSGYSSDPAIVTYVDRILEPGGVLAFHAPYFDETDFREAVMSAGGFAAQSWSRNDFSLMVSELVYYNVSPQIMSLLVGMGPNDFYYVRTGADHFLMRVALPPVPARLFQSGTPAAIRNACVRLLALFDNVDPYLVEPFLTTVYEENIAVDEFGNSLSGYRIDDAPLGLGHCSAAETAIAGGGDLDVALYANPGIGGFSEPIISLFSRQSGWSNAGPGGFVTGRVFQKGPLSHYYTPLAANIADLSFSAMLAVRANRFYTLQPPALPDIDIQRTVVSSAPGRRVSNVGDVWIFEQVGPAGLFETAVRSLGAQGVTLSNDGANAQGFVREGRYADGTVFAWTGFNDGSYSAVVRAEILKPAGEKPSAEELALLQRVLCSARFGTMANTC